MRTPAAQRAGVLAAGAVGLWAVLVATGWAVAQGHTVELLAAFAALATLVVAIEHRGVLIGALVLVAMNGVPFFDTSRVVTGKLTIEDLGVLALIGASLMWVLLDGPVRSPTRAVKVFSWAGSLLLAWCFFEMSRTVIESGVPVARAVYFGRDFIAFGLLLLVLPRVRLGARDVTGLLAVLGAGVAAFAIGQIMTATGAGSPGSLIHFHYTLDEAGITRVYSNMTDLVTAGAAAAIAGSLVARRPGPRLISLALAALLILSTAVQLTRARWIGLLLGCILATAWILAVGSASLREPLRRRLPVGFGLLCVGGFVAMAIPGLVSGGELVSRLGSVFSDIQGGGGTVAVRLQISHTLTGLLGEQWAWGLGFIPPTSHFYLGLPGGSIRNPDVGVLNAVMTMGVVGAVLIYLPVLAALDTCLRRVRVAGADDWLFFAGIVWIVATVASSITLKTLFLPSGLTLTATILALVTRPRTRAAEAPAAEPAESRAVVVPRYPLSRGSQAG